MQRLVQRDDHDIIRVLWQASFVFFTHIGRAQREAMTTTGVFEPHPNLIKLTLDLMAMLGSVYDAALTAALRGGI